MNPLPVFAVVIATSVSVVMMGRRVGHYALARIASLALVIVMVVLGYAGLAWVFFGSEDYTPAVTAVEFGCAILALGSCRLLKRRPLKARTLLSAALLTFIPGLFGLIPVFFASANLGEPGGSNWDTSRLSIAVAGVTWATLALTATVAALRAMSQRDARADR